MTASDVHVTTVLSDHNLSSILPHASIQAMSKQVERQLIVFDFDW